MRKLLLIPALLWIYSGSASAEVRNALVIGNAGYADVAALDNPANDARLMANTLRDLDFNVIEVIDASQVEMKRAVRDFGSRLNEAGREGIGLFYFAGHGLQLGGANYIVPVDAKISGAGDVDIEAINANSVLRMMEYSNSRLSFVVLDACRNNPYSRGFRSGTRGLAKMNAPTGSLIAYATSPGDVAVDGDGENSPYTAALVENMTEPGVPIEKMFRNVRNQVRSTTDNRQTPWESSSLIGDDFYFNTTVEIANKPGGQEITVSSEVLPLNDAATVDVTPPAAAVTPVVIQNDQNIELLYWGSVKDSKNPALLRSYINKYPQGIFTELAELKIKAIKPSAGGAAKPVNQVVVSKAPPAKQQVPEPEPVTLAALNKEKPRDNVADKLKQCAAHLDARRLTTGKGGNAMDCYREVLRVDPDNGSALDGLVQIEQKYADWASTALDRGNLERAERNMIKLAAVNGDSAELIALENRIESIRKESEKPAPQPVEVAVTAAPAKKAARGTSSTGKCETLLESGKLLGRGSSSAWNCYQSIYNAEPGNRAASQGLKKVEDAVLADFTADIREKNLEQANRTLRAFRRASPGSKNIRRMKADYEELKMEMRW